MTEMTGCFHRYLWSCLWLWFSACVAVGQDFDGGQSYLILVNGYTASSNQTLGKRFYQVSYNELKAYKVSDKIKRNPLYQAVFETIERKQLTQAPFAIEFATKAKSEIDRAHLITAAGREEVVAKAETRQMASVTPPLPAAPPPVTHHLLVVNREVGEADRIPGIQVSQATYEQLAKSKLDNPSAQRNLDRLKREIERFHLEKESFRVRWAAEPKETIVGRVTIETASTTHEYSPDNEEPVPMGSMQMASGKLTPEDRLRAFEKRGDPSPLPVAWEWLVENKRGDLLADFERWLRALHARNSEITFDGNTHTIRFSDSTLVAYINFVQEVLRRLEPREFASQLPKEFRVWATHDTNTPDVRSRLEPIDLLSLFIGPNQFAELASRSEFGVLGRNDLVKRSLQHLLNPETYPPVVVASRFAGSTSPGKQTYFLFCGGAPLTVSTGQTSQPRRSRFIDYVEIDEVALGRPNEASKIIEFSCGETKAKLELSAENFKTALPDLVQANARFRFGEDHKIKAVATFPLVNQASASFIEMMKIGTAGEGFKAEPDVPTKNLREDFLQEMIDADFYFAAAHHANLANFGLGSEGGRTLKLSRKTERGIVELVCFLPPFSGTHPGVRITDQDVIHLFKERRKLAEKRRLTVLDIACGSKQCVPSWVRAYELSLKNEPNNGNAQTLDEVPLIIGSGRSFASNQLSELIDHSKYPFTAMKLGAQESLVKELLQFLQVSGFMPSANAGYSRYLLITTSTGERMVF